MSFSQRDVGNSRLDVGIPAWIPVPFAVQPRGTLAMEMLDGALRVGPFLAVTLGIIVLFAGKRLNDAIGFLRELSIPEPVTGGLVFSVLFTIVHGISGISVELDLAARDI